MNLSKIKAIDRVIGYIGALVYGFILVTVPSSPEPYTEHKNDLEAALERVEDVCREGETEVECTDRLEKARDNIKETIFKKELKVNVVDVIERALKDYSKNVDQTLADKTIESDAGIRAMTDFDEKLGEIYERGGIYILHAQKHQELYCTGNSSASEQFCRQTGDKEKESRSSLGVLRKLIYRQCSEDPSCVLYPEYAITTSDSENPLLATGWVLDCIVVIIDHRQSKTSLLVHFADDDYDFHLEDKVGYTDVSFAKKDYLAFFKEEYFSGVADNELKIYILPGPNSKQKNVDETVRLANEYFPSAEVISKRITDKLCGKGDVLFDTRNGELELSGRTTYFCPDTNIMEWIVCTPNIDGTETNKRYPINDPDTLGVVIRSRENK
jgi:hypothetical protein